jgi:hypothetical protein
MARPLAIGEVIEVKALAEAAIENNKDELPAEVVASQHLALSLGYERQRLQSFKEYKRVYFQHCRELNNTTSKFELLSRQLNKTNEALSTYKSIIQNYEQRLRVEHEPRRAKCGKGDDSKTIERMSLTLPSIFPRSTVPQTVGRGCRRYVRVTNVRTRTTNTNQVYPSIAFSIT